MLNQFRAREGAELAAFIREQNATHSRPAPRKWSAFAPERFPPSRSACSKSCTSCSATPPSIRSAWRKRPHSLADRGDIGEEISRLQIHSRQLDEILDAGGEVGKQLDFLLQEMNRETNTILSKTSGLGDLGLRITELALASKAAIEKIREQALNLE